MPFDFDAAVSAPFRMQPGLRRVAAGSAQLTLLAPGARHQREKLAVLSAYAHQALLQRDGFDATPALHALARHAAREHPQAFAWDGQRAEALWLGTAVDGEHALQTAPGHFGQGDEIARCLQGLPPVWRLAGLLCLSFAEDFAIIDARDGAVPWLAVLLPSHWAPEEKVGRHFTAVHAPVADNSLLLKAADALMRLVTTPDPSDPREPPVRWERFVWTITDHPRLHAHPLRLAHPRWQGTPIERAWWRTERQSFIPVPALVPDQAQAIFTIEVDLVPLAEVTRNAARATALHAALASMSDAVLAYRGLSGVREPLLAWLAQQAAAPAAGVASVSTPV